MNKRYIDFVPAKNEIPKGGIAKAKSIKVTDKGAAKPAAKPAPKPIKKITRRIPPANPLLDEEIEIEEIFAEKEEPKKAAKPAPKPAVKPNFVKANVKKRPLGAAKAAPKAASVKVAKAAAKPKMAPEEIAAAAIAKAATPAKPATPKRPAPLGQRAKFINTNKIEKRPLSGVVARKKPLPTPKASELTAKPKAPEKIIAKPEKDSKAGLIIAIILTIILGAAAGTVAFLLLPK